MNKQEIENKLKEIFDKYSDVLYGDDSYFGECLKKEDAEKSLLLEQSKTIKITDFELEIKHNQEGFSIDIWRTDLIEPELLESKQYWFNDKIEE